MLIYVYIYFFGIFGYFFGTFAREIVFPLFKILQIEPVNFKLSLIVISSFSEMAKNIKIANSFRNTGYKNKLSEVVKLIERLVMDVLKREKKCQFFFAII